MRTINSPEYSRNYGFWNEREQQALLLSKVAIAGVGGDGFQLGLKLAQMGVQNFSIADPEIFEPENTNRVPGATISTYGRNKAEVFMEKIEDINPESKVTIYSDGVTEDNVEDFMYDADLVLDESELTIPKIGTMVARQARKQNIPDLMVMNIGFSAQATSFHPNSKKTFEKFMGIQRGMPLDEIGDIEVNFSRVLPFLPKYGDIDALAAVKEGASLPSIAPGVDVASAIGSSQSFLHLVGEIGNKRPDPIWYPRIAYIDAYDFSTKITKFPRFSYYKTLGHMVTRNLLKSNPSTCYSQGHRDARMNLDL